MNKNVIYATIGIILSVLLPIFVVCFINWEWNFEKMDSYDRFFIVFLSFCCICFTFALVCINEEIKNKKR